MIKLYEYRKCWKLARRFSPKTPARELAKSIYQLTIENNWAWVEQDERIKKLIVGYRLQTCIECKLEYTQNIFLSNMTCPDCRAQNRSGTTERIKLMDQNLQELQAKNIELLANVKYWNDQFDRVRNEKQAILDGFKYVLNK